MRLLEIVSPVFLGYLGSAAQFIFRQNSIQPIQKPHASPALLTLIVVGPICVYTVCSITSLTAFGLSNSSSSSIAHPSSGMSVDTLAAVLTAALGILTISTNVAVAYLFPAKDHHK